MDTINRREFNHHVGRVLDRVLATGEPIRVEGRDGRAVVVSPADGTTTVFEQWERSGLIQEASGDPDFLLTAPATAAGDTHVEALLAAMEEDR